MQFRALGQEDPMEKEMIRHSSILAWEMPMDGGAWRATVHGIAKSQTRLSDSTKEENDPAMEDQRWQAGMKSNDSGTSASQFKR